MYIHKYKGQENVKKRRRERVMSKMHQSEEKQSRRETLHFNISKSSDFVSFPLHFRLLGYTCTHNTGDNWSVSTFCFRDSYNEMERTSLGISSPSKRITLCVAEVAVAVLINLANENEPFKNV